MGGQRNIEPLVDEWFAWKSDPQRKRGQKSAGEVRKQVRKWIVKGKPFLLSQFTAENLYEFLVGLSCGDATRNRYKAAFSSFARFLKKKKLLKRNIVRDVEGEEFSEGDPRDKWLDAAVAKRVHDCIPAGEVEKRCAYALATGTAAEKNALKKMRVRDVTIVRNKRGAVEAMTMWVDGGKNRWRRRHVRIVRSRKDKSELFAWCIPSVEAAMKNKLPDALLCASAVRTDRKMLRCIRKASEAAKVERLTLHDGRHTHAVNLLRAGASPQLVKTHLGHKDTNLVWRVYGNYITDDRDYALMDSKAELLDDERPSGDITAVEQEPARKLSH